MNDELLSSFWQHADELRKTLLNIMWVVLFGFLAALYFNPSIFHFLTANANHKMLILSPLEGFILTLKLSFWTGLVLTSPFWIYFLLQFILPALKQREKALILPFVFLSFIFIGLGIGVAYYYTIPWSNQYFELFNQAIGQNAWTLEAYVDYILLIFFGHAVLFEICILLGFLVHMQFISSKWLASKRRAMIVIAFILGAVLTPPDVITQLMFAIPLIGIYELAILYGKLFGSDVN